jgi:hypothetical protein
VIDVASETLVANIALAGHPESFQLEGAGTRIFVNVPTANQIAVVDRAKNEVVATWPTPGVQRAIFRCRSTKPTIGSLSARADLQ